MKIWLRRVWWLVRPAVLLLRGVLLASLPAPLWWLLFRGSDEVAAFVAIQVASATLFSDLVAAVAWIVLVGALRDLQERWHRSKWEVR